MSYDTPASFLPAEDGVAPNASPEPELEQEEARDEVVPMRARAVSCSKTMPKPMSKAKQGRPCKHLRRASSTDAMRMRQAARPHRSSRMFNPSDAALLDAIAAARPSPFPRPRSRSPAPPSRNLSAQVPERIVHHTGSCPSAPAAWHGQLHAHTPRSPSSLPEPALMLTRVNPRGPGQHC